MQTTLQKHCIDLCSFFPQDIKQFSFGPSRAYWLYQEESFPFHHEKPLFSEI